MFVQFLLIAAVVVLSVLVWELWHRMAKVEKTGVTNAVHSVLQGRVNALEAEVRQLIGKL